MSGKGTSGKMCYTSTASYQDDESTKNH